MGRQQDGSRKTLSKEVVQGKKDHWAALPSLSLFFSSILCFACRHIWSIWHMRLLARDRDEFFLLNSNGDGGYLFLIHTVFSCETLLNSSGQGPIGCRELTGSEPGGVREEEREGKDDCVGPALHHSPQLSGIFRGEALFFVGLFIWAWVA